MFKETALLAVIVGCVGVSGAFAVEKPKDCELVLGNVYRWSGPPDSIAETRPTGRSDEETKTVGTVRAPACFKVEAVAWPFVQGYTVDKHGKQTSKKGWVWTNRFDCHPKSC